MSIKFLKFKKYNLIIYHKYNYFYCNIRFVCTKVIYYIYRLKNKKRKEKKFDKLLTRI
jgi:hypothetical protein